MAERSDSVRQLRQHFGDFVVLTAADKMTACGHTVADIEVIGVRRNSKLTILERDLLSRHTFFHAASRPRLF